jgi:histidyl-tRNA synthetase
MTDLVAPQTLRGFRDILPDEMSLRNHVIDRIRAVYEKYGYVPIDTPILEHRSTLVGSGGAETDKQIFFLDTPEKQRAGLRFDLTVPFARIIAQYHPNEIRLPFRRYHIGPVFRADDPQPEQGRFRQFTQFDIDVAGTNSVAADAEIIAAMSDAMQALGLTDEPDAPTAYFVRVSSRRLIDAFLIGIGISEPERAKHVMRVIDKRDKITEAELIQELGPGRVDDSGSRITGVGLDASRIDQILGYVKTTADTRAEVLAALDKLIAPSDAKTEAFQQVEQLLEHLAALSVSEAAARLDPSLTRGLEYYTGPVFECSLPNAGVGSVMGGGRYDGLVSRFRDESVPATGASIGIDRIVTGLRTIGLAAGIERAGAKVIVLVMPGVPEAEASRAAHDLRAAGITAELYVGEAMGALARQLAYANARDMAVAVLIGRKEAQAGTVAIKDLRVGDAARKDITDNEAYRRAGSVGQQVVPRDALVETVRALLAAPAEPPNQQQG